MSVVTDYTALLSGSYWGGDEITGKPLFVTYSFLDAAPASHAFMGSAFSTFQAFDEPDRALARLALEQWADACGLTLLEVPSVLGTINFAWYEFAATQWSTAAGFAYYPESFSYEFFSGPYPTSMWPDYSGDIFLNIRSAVDGLPSMHTLLHEVGHALGFKHPFDTTFGHPETLDPTIDTITNTVMSYRGLRTGTLGPLDRDAAAHVYGAAGSDGTQVAYWSWDPTLYRLTQEGGAGAEVIQGVTVDDITNGGGGGDTITGLEGADTLNGDGGDDLIFGGRDLDRLIGDAGADTLFGDEADFTFFADNSTAADTLSGGTGDDLIFGGGDHDQLIGGAGADTLIGGDGVDTAVFSGNRADYSIAVRPNWGLVVRDLRAGAPDGTDVIEAEVQQFADMRIAFSSGATDSAETLNGTDQRDVLHAIGGNDLIRGYGGADALDGGEGADTVFGGLGNDLYFVDHFADLIHEAPNEGGDTLLASVDFALANNVEVLVLVGAALYGTGNNQANRIIGNDGANTLAGLAGADTLDGGLGDDTYRVDGLDVLIEQPGGGLDLVLASRSFSIEAYAEIEKMTFTGAEAANGTGNALANLIIGNAQDNRLEGLGGSDTLSGGGGDDTLRGGDGADSLFGGGGLDRLEGGAGNDLYRLTGLGVTVLEGAGSGTDLVTSTVSFTVGNHVENLTLVGASTADGIGNGLANVILGNNAANQLDGGAGSDSLWGANGNDTLIGGAGADTLSGGNGLDVFRYALATQGTDRVTDYLVAQDTIEVNAAGFSGGLVVGMTINVPERFVASTTGAATAATGTGQFIYEMDTLTLWFDADGMGGAAARAVLTLASAPAGFNGSEIVVIA